MSRRVPMTKGRKTLTAVLALFVLGVATRFWLSQPEEPSYEHLTLTQWLDKLDAGKAPEEPPNGEVAIAIRAIGTNSLPQLLRWVQAKESPTDKLAGYVNDKQSLVTLPQRWLYLTQNAKATMAFAILGPQAQAAIPRLAPMLYDSEHPDLVMHSTEVMGHLGPGVLPYLAQALASTNRYVRKLVLAGLLDAGTNAEFASSLVLKAIDDPEVRVRSQAAVALGFIAKPQLGVPVLVKLLSHRDRYVRLSAVFGLGHYGTNAISVLTALRAFSASCTNDAALTDETDEAIAAITPKPAANPL